MHWNSATVFDMTQLIHVTPLTIDCTLYSVQCTVNIIQIKEYTDKKNNVDIKIIHIWLHNTFLHIVIYLNTYIYCTTYIFHILL